MVPLVIVGIAGLGYLVMLLWNWLLPTLFVGVREIDYMQALGVLVLSKILFGGLRGHGCHGRWHKMSPFGIKAPPTFGVMAPLETVISGTQTGVENA
jgi:hypothetical protein